MHAFALFTETQDALREAKARTGLNSGARGILAVSCKQGLFRVEIVTHRKGASGKCDIQQLTEFLQPSEAAAFLRSYSG